MKNPRNYIVGFVLSLAVLLNFFRINDIFCFCPDRHCFQDPFSGKPLCISKCGCDFPSKVIGDGDRPPAPTPCQNNTTASTTIIAPDKSVEDGSVAINSFAVRYRHDLRPNDPPAEIFSQEQRILTEEGSVSISPPISDLAYYKVQVTIENSTDPQTVTDQSFASIGTCGKLFHISLPVSKP